MIKFNCEGCGVSLKANDENSGSKMPCPKCNKTVMVPGLHTSEGSRLKQSPISEKQVQYAVERRDKAVRVIDFTVGLTQFATFIATVACVLLIAFSFTPVAISGNHSSQYFIAGAMGLGCLLLSVPAILSFLHAIRLLADMHAVHFPRT